MLLISCTFIRTIIGPGSDNAKEAAIAAVLVRGMGEGNFLDYGEELFPPSYLNEISLNQIMIADDERVDSFDAVRSSPKNDGMIFKADESDNSSATEEKEVDPFDDLENVMQ